MADNELTALEEAVQRLRDLHHDAPDSDQPRAAFHLALAISDLTSRMPSGDRRLGEFTAEGLARLNESGNASPAAEQARNRLTNLAAANGTEDQSEPEPATIKIGVGDLNWDLDWSAIQGPAEVARALTRTLPLITSMMPPGTSLVDGLTSFTEVIDAFDKGQWSARHDKALASSRRQLELAGPGFGGVTALLRAVAMIFTLQRCQETERKGTAPHWPDRDEFDALIADLEAADDLSPAFIPQLQAMDGMEHMLIGIMIMARVHTDIRREPKAIRDAAWRAEAVLLTIRASDHLRQAPPAFANGVRPILEQLRQVATVLGQQTPSSSGPFPPQERRSRSPEPPATAPPMPTDTPASNPRQSDPDESAPRTTASVSQLSAETIEGLRLLIQDAEGAVPEALRMLMTMMGSPASGQWSPQQDEQLDSLRRKAEGLSGQEGQLPLSATLSGIVAMGEAFRAHQRMTSPKPEERPTAAELGVIVDSVESALEKMSRVEATQPGFLRTPYDIHSGLHVLAGILLADMAQLDDEPGEIRSRAHAHFSQVPDAFLDEFAAFRDLSILARLRDGRLGPADDSVRSIAEENPNTWDQDGGDLDLALEIVARAKQTRDPADVGNAIMELQFVWAWIAAGSPARAKTLFALGEMRNLLASLTGDLSIALDALDTSVAAARAAGTSQETRMAAHLIVSALALLAFMKRPQGPLTEVSEIFHAALTDADANDCALRATVSTGIAVVTGMLAVNREDDALPARSRTMMADASQMLPEGSPTSDWYAAAKTVMCGWLAIHAVLGDDAELTARVLENIDRMERVVVSWPKQAGEPVNANGLDLAAELKTLQQARQTLTTSGKPGQDSGCDHESPAFSVPHDPTVPVRNALEKSIRMLGRNTASTVRRQPLAPENRPTAASLRALSADLHRTIPGAVEDRRLRGQVDWAIGMCQAELYWSDTREDQVLHEAVIHLNRALISDDHALPTMERADLLAVLASCYREAGTRHGDLRMTKAAGRTMLAALREHARCVMISRNTSQALALAAQASESVTQAIGWYLDDGLHQQAIDAAETGRGLVLASVVVAGRVGETLRDAGLSEAADGWQAGTETGRVSALNALRDTSEGHRLLTAPTGRETALSMMSTRFDAMVYLVPPAEIVGGEPGVEPSGRTGHALLLRPVLGQLEHLSLPGLTIASIAAVQDYMKALNQAVAAVGLGRPAADGFRGGPDGTAWTDALERLGGWTYQHIMRPLLDQVRGWGLDHVPHLALIPIGLLAAVPYAAAWTEDETVGGRQYAIENLVLSYGASARLLTEVSRRPRQKLHERVFLASDPNGEFPLTRRATRAIANRQYRDAMIFGTNSAPNGPATAAALLTAFPEGDRPGASLLQLSTHGTLVPEPRLQTKGGWLPLTDVLSQARNRPSGAAGGLVITNACLTDGPLDAFDESLTLSTAFLTAGATAVIGTRWPVDDDTAAVLSLRLHHHLHAGRSPAEALRRAQLDLLRPSDEMRATLDPHLAAIDAARLSHPASWAGQVHHGI